MAWIWLLGTTNKTNWQLTREDRTIYTLGKWAQVETIRGGADAEDGGKTHKGRK